MSRQPRRHPTTAQRRDLAARSRPPATRPAVDAAWWPTPAELAVLERRGLLPGEAFQQMRTTGENLDRLSGEMAAVTDRMDGLKRATQEALATAARLSGETDYAMSEITRFLEQIRPHVLALRAEVHS